MQRNSYALRTAFCMALLSALCCIHATETLSASFKKLDALLENGRAEKIFPGAVACIYHRGNIIYHKAFGNYTYNPRSKKVTTQTLFDVASLTKVITTIAAMLLHDAGKLSLEDPISLYIPCFAYGDKKNIMVKHLLTHTSGLTDKSLLNAENSPQFLEKICSFPLAYQPGTNFSYTDTDMILLQKIIETITKEPFELFVQRRITKPLHMHETTFNPQESSHCAPTRLHARNRPYLLQGEVDDDNAYQFGGISGHTGLFSTTDDFARCMLMLLHDGTCIQDGKKYQFIKPGTVAEWTSLQANFSDTDEKGKRGYGFEIGRHLSSDAFGHFGWTGTSAWANKKDDLCCILFTNRVHPSYAHQEKIRAFRTKFHDALMETLEI